MDLRGKILAADDLKRELLTIEEWGETIYVREMTGTERDEYEAGLMQLQDKPLVERLENMRARLCVLTVVDEHGTRIFNADDVEALGAKNGAVLTRISDLAALINRLDVREVDEDAGNLEPSGSVASISG